MTTFHMRTMLHSVLAYVRALAEKRTRAFTCCAGCDVLPVPVGDRLCVSITPQWETDAVLLAGRNAVELAESSAALREAMPWLRRIHVPAGVLAAPVFGVFTLPESCGEADLHQAEALAEHFLVLGQGKKAPASSYASPPLLPVDFFTPNGLPLLFAASGGSAEAPNFLPAGPAGRTKSLCALFAGACAADPALAAQRDAAGYARAFAHWAYAERHGIIAPSPLFRPLAA